MMASRFISKLIMVFLHKNEYLAVVSGRVEREESSLRVNRYNTYVTALNGLNP